MIRVNVIWMGLALAGLPLHAIDRDGSGISDVYESMHGQVLSVTGNADSDAFTDYEEYLMGTNPLDANDPGNLVGGSGEQFFLKIPSQKGLRFRVNTSANLSAWDAGPIQVVTVETEFIYYDKPSGPGALFWELELLDPLDGDGDTLDQWEESQLNTSDTTDDTDGDTLSDAEEYADYGTDPTALDSDGDGFNDNDEVASASDATMSGSVPIEVLANGMSHPLVVRALHSGERYFQQALGCPLLVNALHSGELHEQQALSRPLVVRADHSGETHEKRALSAPLSVRASHSGALHVRQAWSNILIVRNDFLPDL